MKIIFVLSLLLLNFPSLGQSYEEQVTKMKCQREWKYLDFPNELSGIIIFYDQPTALCGKLASASVALIRTKANDTVRVLTLCDTKERFNSPNRFNPGDKVYVTSSKIPSFRIDIIPLDPQSCILLTTYLGSVQISK